MLYGKNIIIGITGSIAAYKACDIVSRLRDLRAQVNVIMTESATHFVAPLTLQTLSQNEVFVDQFKYLAHVGLAETADLILVAPATANCIAKLAHGISDDVLSATVLDTHAPLYIAPAMHQSMYTQRITEENIERLKKRGAFFINPEYGKLASGGMGIGRLAKTEKIVDTILNHFQSTESKKDPKKERPSIQSKLNQKTVLITAGPTQEYIDPVRYISNASSGKMGFALANAALHYGAKVILISGPVPLNHPDGAEVVYVQTAQQMEQEVMKYFQHTDIVISAAAIADYRPETIESNKAKKNTEKLTINLVKNPDILSELGKKKGNKLLVGFALETDNLEDNAKKKLLEKNLDMIILNTPKSIAHEKSQAILFLKSGETKTLSIMTKDALADIIMKCIEKMV